MKFYEQFYSLLPLVEKPGKYIGGELGSIVKPHSQEILRFALVFPDLYEIGMSHFGGQIIYHIVNKEPNLACERVYLPWVDMAQIHRKYNIPLLSLETHTPLYEFDVVGFTLENELSYPNIFEVLDLGRISPFSLNRAEKEPLVIAGGVAAFHPEPVADIFDLVYVGDAEVHLVPLLMFIRENRKKLSRLELLEKIGQRFECVYVPQFYEPTYHNDTFIGFDVKKNSRFPIRPGVVPELKDEHYPSSPIVPWVEITHDRLRAELVRGCGRGCRFCEPGFIYRPIRERKPQNVANEIAKNYALTGWEECGVIALSATDYTAFDELLAIISEWSDKEKVAFALPSIRIKQLPEKALATLSAIRKMGLTFAPEAATERLRNVINKPLDENEFFESIKNALIRGWRQIKLYFMIGLPTETDEDVVAIAEMINNAASISRGFKANLNITISPFVPKPHTPFAWEKQISPEEIYRKQQIIKDAIKFKNINLMMRNPYISIFEGILSRGVRKFGKVLYQIWQNGGAFSTWKEHFNPQLWLDVLKEFNIDLASELAQRNPYQMQPWEIIDKGEKKEFLLAERERAYKGILTPPCWERDCEKCSFGNLPSQVLVRNSPPTTIKNQSREIAKKPRQNPQAEQLVIRIEYSQFGDMKFLSHLDTIRVWERLIRRARLPVQFTTGHHIRIKAIFGPPLPLGCESDAEYIDIFLVSPVEKKQVEKMLEYLPNGFRVTKFSFLKDKPEPLQNVVSSAIWECCIPLEISEICRIMKKIEDTNKIFIQRHKKEVDIRPFLLGWKAIETANGTKLSLLLKAGNRGSGRPQEFLQFAGIDKEVIAKSSFRRCKLLIKSGNDSINPWSEKIIF